MALTLKMTSECVETSKRLEHKNAPKPRKSVFCYVHWLTKVARTEWGQRYDTSTPSFPLCPLLWPVSYIWYLETGLAIWIQSIVAVCIVFGVCFSLCSTVVIICTICFNDEPQ